MRRLVWDTSFRRACRRGTRRSPELGERIFAVVAALAGDPVDPQLKTHRWRTQLERLGAGGGAYDCRIVLALEPDPAGGEDAVGLAVIGTQDEVS